MKKKDNIKDYKKKLRILEDAKKIVVKDGWSKNLLKKLLSNKIKSSDLTYYFPNGYIDILELSLIELNKSLENKLNKINIINFPMSRRIKKILLVRLEILNEEKIFFKKTFNHLILPQNNKIMKKNLYNSVDSMWYLAGDNSTDFSFYTKRLILAAIYTNALYKFFNKDIEHAIINIDKNLKIISNIPKLKERFSFIKDSLPIFLKGIFN
tara:strand:+ start:94 stop:723 length:630 start_codon:yes stop_codon:yes gene_type:complete